jgi:hypothetical protein
MRPAESDFLQEEARLRGAKPRLKAVLFPFDLDIGLAPGEGVFENIVYGGEPGRLAMGPGYHTSGTWTSPVMQAFSPYLSQMRPAREADSGLAEVAMYARVGQSAEEVGGAAFSPLSQDEDFELEPYYQVKVELSETVRAWAVDLEGDADAFTAYGVDQAPDGGYESYAATQEPWGWVAGLQFSARLTLPEAEIITPGALEVGLARDFGELQSARHRLDLDNRAGQWRYFPGNRIWEDFEASPRQIELYHGWETPAGQVVWQLLYRGEVERLSDMTHAWQAAHRVCLESQDRVAARLQQVIGAADAEGEPRPFMRGAYLARAELRQTMAATVSAPVKTGSGAAVLRVLGDFRGDYPQDYLIQAETTGAVGAASFRWSKNLGQSWQDTGLTSAGADDPVELEEGLSVCWEAGPGDDLVSGDRWTFSATPVTYQYHLAGGPFLEMSAIYLNGEETADRVAAEADSGLITVTGRSAAVTARVVKDLTTHPVDIISDILAEVGLAEAMHQDSFALARGVTPEYAIGVRFENVSAAQAIREILRRCLLDLWVDFGEIRLAAFL